MAAAAAKHVRFPPPVEEAPKPRLVPCYLCGTPVPPTNRFSDDVFAICARQDSLACLDRHAAPTAPQEAPEPLEDPPIAKTVRASRRTTPKAGEGP